MAAICCATPSPGSVSHYRIVNKKQGGRPKRPPLRISKFYHAMVLIRRACAACRPARSPLGQCLQRPHAQDAVDGGNLLR
ncbi:MAG: hypothetical protein PHO66_08400, partial [Eubacteriales bacterium]|nr:hypothetical protein [Eubacteriales bacterium]